MNEPFPFVEFEYLGDGPEQHAPFGEINTGDRVRVVREEVVRQLAAEPSSFRHCTEILLTDAAEIVTDAALARNKGVAGLRPGSVFRVTLEGNRTLAAPINPADGQRATWEFIQDATGNRTIALDPVFAFGADITGVMLSTAGAARDYMTAIYNATAAKWYVVGFVKGY